MKEYKGIKAFLFDFDGTVADTLKAIRITMELTAEKMGFPVDVEKAYAMAGSPVVAIGERIYGKENAEKFFKIYSEINSKYILDLSTVFEGMEDILTDIREHNKKAALVTSRTRKSLDVLLDHFKIRDYFDVLCTKESTEKHKPEPDPVLFALKELGLKANDAVMIGDTYDDVTSGTNAGTATIGVSWGISGREKLKILAHPDFLADSPEELMQIIKSMY